MKKLLFLVILLALFSCQEQEVKAKAKVKPTVGDGHNHAPVPPPQYEMEGMAFSPFNYEIPLQGFTHPNKKLSDYSNRPTLIFYFSATCPHCMKTYPEFQKEIKKYQDRVNIITVASPRNTPVQIQTFITKQNVTHPLFQDKETTFSRKYGIGTVPLVILIDQNKSYLRYGSWHKQKIDFFKELDKILLESKNP